MTPPRPVLAVESLDAAIALLGRGGRRGILSMTGESMGPTLRSGERVLVEFEARDIARGDLVLYRQLDYLVVHRVLGPATREVDPALRTRGDGSPGLDPPLERSRIRGRVVALERDGTWYRLDGGAAAAYALGVALHDLTWAGLHAVAVALDRRLGRTGAPGFAARAVAAADRGLLGLAHRVLFRWAHPRSSHAPPRSRDEAR